MLISITIGIATTVGIAWVAMLAERRVGDVSAFMRSPPTPGLSIEAFGYFGVATASVRIDVITDQDAAPSAWFGRSFTVRERMALSSCLRRVPSSFDGEVFVTAAGWPFLSLASEVDFDHPVRVGGSSGRTPFVYGLRHAINLPWLERGSFARLSEDGFECVALPFVPMWPGFAANSAIFAATWFLLGAARRALRRCRQHPSACAECGYDLIGLQMGAPCPECGGVHGSTVSPR